MAVKYHRWFKFSRLACLVLSIVFVAFVLFHFSTNTALKNEHSKIKLPLPILHSGISIEEALYRRRSIRQYSKEALTLEQVAQLLWAAQGITSSDGFRTTPSAGAIYPLDLYLICGNVMNLPVGIYHYLPDEHAIEKLNDNDARAALATLAFDQQAIKNGAIDIIISGTFERTIKKYGNRGRQYVYMEAGHAAQNIYLQSVSLNLGTVSIGAFDSDAVRKILGLKNNVMPIYIMPVGKNMVAQK